MKFTMSVSPLIVWDAASVLPYVLKAADEAIKMVPQESQADEQPVFDYLVANVGKKDKPDLRMQHQREASSTSHFLSSPEVVQDVLRHLMQDLLHSSLVSRCTFQMQQDVLLSGGNPAATSPYTVNKDSKKGPAWANSLFEDNAEHGLGMHIGQKYLRDQQLNW